MVKLSKEVFDDYSEYRFESIFLYDNNHEYTIYRSATSTDNYKIDTVDGKNKKTVFIK